MIGRTSGKSDVKEGRFSVYYFCPFGECKYSEFYSRFETKGGIRYKELSRVQHYHWVRDCDFIAFTFAEIKPWPTQVYVCAYNMRVPI